MVVEIANVDGAESRYHGRDKTILNLLVPQRKQRGEYKSEPIHIPPIDTGETDIDVRITPTNSHVQDHLLVSVAHCWESHTEKTHSCRSRRGRRTVL